MSRCACSNCFNGDYPCLARQQLADECDRLRAALVLVCDELRDCRAVLIREGYKMDTMRLDIARALEAADAVLGGGDA